MNRRPWVLIGLGLLLGSCGPPVPEGGTPGPGMGREAARSWDLTPGERAWATARKAGGGLRVASVVREGAFTVETTLDKAQGLHADLARALGAYLDLPVTFLPVTFDQLFAKDGVVSDEVKTGLGPAYEPDIFTRADLLAFDLSALDWRRRLMDFHPVFPNRAVLVSPRGREIGQLSELYHRRVAVIANTSHELFMKQLEKNLGLGLQVLTVPFPTDLFALVRQGKADAFVRDGNWVMLAIQKNTDFNVTLPLMPTEQLSWAASKNDPVFGRILDKFLAKVHADGEFEEFWLKAYRVSYGSYLNLIGNDPVPSWTEADRAVIRNLETNGLRAAVHQGESVYEPLPDGSFRGVSYNLLLEIAKRLGVPLKIRTAGFGEFFSKGGQFPEEVRTNPEFTYKPDIFQTADVLVGNFTPLDWRKKFLSFISLYPSKLVYVVRKAGGITGPAPGLKLSLLADTSYTDWVKGNKQIRPQDVILVHGENQTIPMVVDGRADLTLTDALLALAQLPEYPGITIYPAGQEVEYLSWAVSKDNSPLAEVLRKTLEDLRNNGVFGSVWQKYYKVSLAEYLGLLALDKGSSP